jgi:hypothetical protein
MKLLVSILVLTMAGSNSIHTTKCSSVINDNKGTDTTRRREQLPAVNINYMIRGHFYAASPRVAYLDEIGGWGGSDNNFQKVDKSLPKDNNKFEVYIDTSSTTDLGNGYAAYNVYVINTAGDTMFFEAQDSRLYMIVQAKDKSGEWKPIEYLPNSWCGNSYHKLYLPGGAYWKFETPVFEGRYKTSLRISLSYRQSPQGKNEIIYSNEIRGSINQGQFWKKKKYTPNGIMDPYLE